MQPEEQQQQQGLAAVKLAPGAPCPIWSLQWPGQDQGVTWCAPRLTTGPYCLMC
jgi:hypothetical protein